VQGSELAMPALDKAAHAVLAELQKNNPRAGDLKTIIVRCSQDGQAVVALYTKLNSFDKITLPEGVKGLRVYYSDPKSPASVPTKLLYELGDAHLTDRLQGREFTYDVDSFFQVNLPIFDQALARIKENFADQAELVDMYAGTGSIGLSVSSRAVDLIELDPATVAMARLNADASDLDVTVVETSSEKALDYIVSDKPLIFDPPRAGLHEKVVNRTLAALPPRIAYLSCNPATQARDLARLTEAYTITYFETFNFFPHTPHIETLAILERKA
jgi:23S rRNA (uracil1939-C5)-methyltransferase